MAKLKVREQLAMWRELYPAPCQAACPVHTDARSYVTLTGDGNFHDAFAFAREPNPLAGICGSACSAPCEDVCTRGEFDRPVKIRQLKRFLADRYEVDVTRLPVGTGRRVAVIGAGPAGLAAAHDLRLLGHEVTIFDAALEPGGMATLGVPRFRLSLDTIRDDVEAIKALGVTFELGRKVGEHLSLAELRESFDAVFLATGAMKLNELNVPGRSLRGVVQALPYLEEANLGGRPWTGKRVAVIGGGYTAMDAARTAVRLGADSVTILYRRTRHETEVHEEELQSTLDEGSRIQYLVSPLALKARADGSVSGIECVRNALGAPDSSGRPRPEPIAGSEFTFEADMVILAVGQAADAGDLGFQPADDLSAVDAATLSTRVPGVFAGGDFVSGPSTIIEAVRDGRRAAESIDAYLRPRGANGSQNGHNGNSPLAFKVRPSGSIWGARNGPRVIPTTLALDCEVEIPLTESAAVSEGMRCLYCGLLPTIVLDDCTVCHACVQVCPEECIHLVKVDVVTGGEVRANGFFDAESYQIDAEQCISCGRCMGACPVGAIIVAT